MPPVNLDKAAAALPPWDFTVTIGGVEYATRPPTLGEDKTLLEPGNLTDDQCVALVWSLFQPPGPSLADATRDVVLVFYVELRKYILKRTAVTLAPLVKQVEQMRTATDKLRLAANAAAGAARGRKWQRESVN